MIRRDALRKLALLIPGIALLGCIEPTGPSFGGLNSPARGGSPLSRFEELENRVQLLESLHSNAVKDSI